MKIGLFTDHFYPQLGGITTSVMTLKESLEAKGHEVFVVTVMVPGHIDKSDHIIRIPSFRFLDMQVGYFAPKSVYQKLVKENFDVIHTHTEFLVGKLGMKLAYKEGIPMLHTSHTIYDVCIKNQFPTGNIHVPMTMFLNGLLKSQLKNCQHLVVPSYKSKGAISHMVDTPISVIPTGISMEKFSAEEDTEKLKSIKTKLGINEQDKVVLSISRLSSEKRVDVILKQFYKVAKDPSLKLLVLGDGPERTKLEELAKSFRIDGQVIFTGHIPSEEVSVYYQISDFFISASKVETQGLTILEAMASKVPVIVVDDTNVKGIVSHNKTGWIFDRDDELGHILDRLLHNPRTEPVQRITDQAYKVAVSLSDIHYVENIEKIYAEAHSSFNLQLQLNVTGKVRLNNQKRMRIN